MLSENVRILKAMELAKFSTISIIRVFKKLADIKKKKRRKNYDSTLEPVECQHTLYVPVTFIIGVNIYLFNGKLKNH